MNALSLLRSPGASFGAVILGLIAAASSLFAQQYSVNVIGYADVTFAAGTNLVANPLNASNNTISNLFRGVPDGTVFAPWIRPAASFGPANRFSSAAGWTDPGATFAQPDGGFLSLPSATTLSFVGDVTWSSPPCFTTAALSVMSVMPELCVIGSSTPPDGTELCLWNTSLQDWDCYYWFDQLFEWVTAEFDPVTPEIPPGQAALVSTPQTFNARFRRGGAQPSGPVVIGGAQRNGTNLTFRFEAAAVVGWTLFRSVDLNSNDWTAIDSQVATPASGFVSVNAPLATNGMAFYKLGSVASPNALLNPSRQGTQFRFQFYGTSGTTYTIQRASTLDGGEWQAIRMESGEGRLITVTDSTATGATGYYRLQF